MSKQVSDETLNWYTQKLQPEIKELVSSLNYLLPSIAFVRENQNYYLRIAISHEDHPIALDDCELVSKQVDKFLDKKDLIPFPYNLEVESPGFSTINTKNEFILDHKDMLWSVQN